MKVLVTGAGGQLGRALVGVATGRGFEACGLDRARLDVVDRPAVGSALREQRPDWVLHCAAATKVDRCETETAWAESVNADAPRCVAEACQELDIGLVHFSTDFVFDGTKTTPYVETDPLAPLSVYGRTKAEGERAVVAAGLTRFFVVRTQWVYGPGGRCFPAAILDRARSGQPLRVVDDQVGSPTMTVDLAEATFDLLESGAASGLYHAANRGIVSWYEFARCVLDRTGFTATAMTRIKSEELGLPAPRPAYSALDTTKLERAIGHGLPTVASGLDRWLEAEGLGARTPTRRES